ncbi:MAG TPA: hypothetical protein VMZ26_13825 [Pyrinomonadaceae bacterium]|nr:hypothetical protein [Pyrinomonadaceae bacterium]
MNSVDVAIENFYKAFSDVPVPTSIEGCPHCIDDKNIEQLLQSDLRSLSPDDLSSYASSAFLTVGDVGDYLYFLPRILEISITDRCWWPDIEVTGRALGVTDVPKWGADKQRALIELFTSVLRRFIERGEYDYIDDWMCAIARSGLDVRPFLRIIEENSAALVHYVGVNAESLQKSKLANHFWETSDKGQDEIIEWLRSETVHRICSKASSPAP